MCKPKVKLGKIVATPGALEALEESGQSPSYFLDRHVQKDWGKLCDEDKQLNEQAVIDGTRILSAYQTVKGVKLWIITLPNKGWTHSKPFRPCCDALKMTPTVLPADSCVSTPPVG